MRVRHGWITRERESGATPPRIHVTLRQGDGNKSLRVFDDSPSGAQEAADYVSGQIGDNWGLENWAFLGYRIFTET